MSILELNQYKYSKDEDRCSNKTLKAQKLPAETQPTPVRS